MTCSCDELSKQLDATRAELARAEKMLAVCSEVHGHNVKLVAQRAELLAELARLRAEMPSDAERAELEHLRELRADEHTPHYAEDLRNDARRLLITRSVPHNKLGRFFEKLAALLAPEGEVERG